MDENTNGEFTLEELTAYLKKAGYDATEHEAIAIIRRMDTDGSVTISLNEFDGFMKLLDPAPKEVDVSNYNPSSEPLRTSYYRSYYPYTSYRFDPLWDPYYRSPYTYSRYYDSLAYRRYDPYWRYDYPLSYSRYGYSSYPYSSYLDYKYGTYRSPSRYVYESPVRTEVLYSSPVRKEVVYSSYSPVSTAYTYSSPARTVYTSYY